MPSLKPYGLDIGWPGVGELFDRHIDQAEISLSDIPGVAVALYLSSTGFSNSFTSEDKTYPTAPYFPSKPQYLKAMEITNG